MSAVLEKPITKKMTNEEFETSSFAETHELIRGELYPIMPAGTRHGIVTNRLSTFITFFAMENNLGEVAAAETGFKLLNQTTVGADIGFISKKKLEKFGVPDSFFPTAPDLAVEVISPSNTSEEIATKVEDYLNSGSKLVWVVYPRRKVVVVYRQNSTVSFLHENETLEGEDVLPNLTIQLEKIFGNLPKSKE